jgi:hypothetical protein
VPAETNVAEEITALIALGLTDVKEMGNWRRPVGLLRAASRRPLPTVDTSPAAHAFGVGEA